VSYLAAGFTPEEEKTLLSSVESKERKLDELLEINRRADQLKLVTAGAALFGLLFTMTRFGELVAALRRRRES
jgi:hypothetical protein